MHIPNVASSGTREILQQQGTEGAFADALIAFRAMRGDFHLFFTRRSPSLSSACYKEGYLCKGIFISCTAFTGDTKV